MKGLSGVANTDRRRPEISLKINARRAKSPAYYGMFNSTDFWLANVLVGYRQMSQNRRKGIDYCGVRDCLSNWKKERKKKKKEKEGFD